MADADVAIIGGGPAGCSAALTLLAEGRSVVVLGGTSAEKKPTETSAPALRQALRSLEADSAISACEPCHGIVTNWGRTNFILQPSVSSPFGDAWFIHRARFESCMQNDVREKGGVWLEAMARKVIFTDDMSQIEADGRFITAKWVVFANGSPAWTASIIGQKTVSIDSMVAAWAAIPMKSGEQLLRMEATDLGWWYSCPGEGCEHFACLVTDTIEARLLQISDVSRWNSLYHSTQIFRESHNGAPALNINIVSAGTLSLSNRHGNRWVAAGDAMAKLDPLGSSGVITALESGRRAAVAVTLALKHQTTAFVEYDRWASGLIEEFTRQRKFQYGLEQKRRSSGFWQRRPGAY